MKLYTAKYLSIGLLLAGLVIGCAGVFLLTEGTAAYIATEVLMLALLVIGIVIAAVWGRCPNCGYHLFYKMMKWKECPNCRKKIDERLKYTPKAKIK